jgi:hypothetical protein
LLGRLRPLFLPAVFCLGFLACVPRAELDEPLPDEFLLAGLLPEPLEAALDDPFVCRGLFSEADLDDAPVPRCPLWFGRAVPLVPLAFELRFCL